MIDKEQIVAGLKNDLKKKEVEKPIEEKVDFTPKLNEKNKKKKKKKNRKPQINESTELKENLTEEQKNKIIQDKKFEKFSEEFQKDPVKNGFLVNTLSDLRSRGYTDITNETYLLMKMQHPALKAIIIHPDYDDLQENRTGCVYFVKPMYIEEENEYLSTYPDRRVNPEIYVKYALTKCIVHPRITEEEVYTIPAGRGLVIFNTIKNISDLTKKFEIVEI